jgi:hypothetical protein
VLSWSTKFFQDAKSLALIKHAKFSKGFLLAGPYSIRKVLSRRILLNADAAARTKFGKEV